MSRVGALTQRPFGDSPIHFSRGNRFVNTARRHARNRTPVRASLTAAVLMAMAAPAVFAQDCAGGAAGQAQCFGATATGVFASAFGDSAVASGNNTSAFGHLSTASGANGTAMGDGSLASNTITTAVG